MFNFDDLERRAHLGLAQVYFAVRKSDNEHVTWIEDTEGMMRPFQVTKNGLFTCIPLDASVQWNEEEFYAKVYPAKGEEE